jgi:hypothetical protein
MSSDIKKHEIVLESKKWIRTDFGNNEILINPYISLKNKMELFRIYLDSFFDKEIYISYLEAEYSLIFAIVDLCTDINIEGLKIDTVVNSGLWAFVKKNIENYDEFRFELHSVVQYMRENEIARKSVGGVIDNASIKILDFLEKISSLDISQDGVMKLIEKISETGIVQPSPIQKQRKKKIAEK